MRKARPRRGSTTKQTKVQLRLRPEQREILAKAARLRQTTLSNFMLESAYSAAQQVLAEQAHFVLSPARWQAFCEALDAPPREIPALKQLLTEDSPFDGPESPSLAGA